ncbi:hypothetical protein Tsubulata_033359 [Turnera subulata]|uniref:Benzyl alcohol O-benzoyltransferase n=1 Tax=Turnera subulata TaxID=218843 RepID=A0A9Q0G105_9ROSI|nr:hypothetical protein Tsubulata_033359 [Turnera subulata]
MSDARGIFQFCSAVSEIACGADAPSILPVWERHVLDSIDPPKVTHQHFEYVDTAPAYLWKCRTIALQLPRSQEVRLMCTLNARHKHFNPPLPRGYYGNAIVCPVALTTASKLTRNPLGYALELVKEAKAQFSGDYFSSVASLMVTKGRPGYVTARTFELTGVTHIGFLELDYGWGVAAYGGPVDAGYQECPGCGYFFPFTNKKGEKRIIATFSLPAIAMERLSRELNTMFDIDQPSAGHLGLEMSIKSSL